MKKILALCLMLTAGIFAFGQTPITYTKLKKIIPSAGLPKEVKPQRSNNNIDFVRYGDYYYLVFRTAPTHFASKRTKLYVVRSKDLQNWEFEQEIALGSDKREPRFLVLNGQLFLYFFQAGKNPFKFDPQHIWVSEFKGHEDWTLQQIPNLDAYVPWRVKEHNGIAYMSAYYGKGLYRSDHHGELRLFTSTDGTVWTPISKEPQVSTHGAEEGEFEFDNEGNLWGTVRLEGSGAYIVFASKDSLEKWHLYPTKDKYDSALMFRHNNDMYVISRRNLAGKFDQAPRWMPYFLSQKFNLIKYSFTEKVTALFKLNKESKMLEYVFDFPSTGDTAFPGVEQAPDGNLYMMNYSNNIHGMQKTWIAGQLGKTFIYLTKIIFK